VEDEPAVRALAAGVLRRQPVMVLEAASAREALHLARQHSRLDLLLTDIVMPGGSGHELARELRRERPRLKVIYMSGYSDESVRAQASREGIPFVQKPFTPHALVKLVNDALQESS
jgi:CheY-like chemotaxis protein